MICIMKSATQINLNTGDAGTLLLDQILTLLYCAFIQI